MSEVRARGLRLAHAGVLVAVTACSQKLPSCDTAIAAREASTQRTWATKLPVGPK
jgi:hypothetical protein